MLKIQQQYIGYLDQLMANLSGTAILAESSDSLALLRAEIAEAELLIPVIGSFSAGKSSMLNAWIGRLVLPVDILPETELATELRYGADENVLAITPDGERVRFALGELHTVKKQSAAYSHMQIFLDANQLQKQVPLVLVDMPGFNSTLANHQKALSTYLSRGVHFILVISVEEGTISRSMERQLLDILELGRNFSVVLSKTNLRSQADAESVRTAVEKQVDDVAGARTIHAVGSADAHQFDSLLAAINPPSLFMALFHGQILAISKDLIDSVSITISGLSRSREDNQQVLIEMEQALKELQHKKAKMIEDVRQKQASIHIKKIVSDVGCALHDATEELVLTVINNGQEAVSRTLTEVIRSALIRNIKSEMMSIADQAIGQMALDLQDINRLISGMTSGENWLNDFSQQIRSALDSAGAIMGKLHEHLGKTERMGKWLGVITKIVASVAAIANPVLDLIILFLPNILSGFHVKKQRENIRNALATEVIPGIEGKLSRLLPDLIDEQVSGLIDQIGQEFEKSINHKRHALEAVQKEKDESMDTIQKEIKKYTILFDRMKTDLAAMESTALIYGAEA